MAVARLGQHAATLHVQGVERLSLGVDPNVLVVLEHPSREMARDRFEDVSRHAHLGELQDDRVPQT